MRSKIQRPRREKERAVKRKRGESIEVVGVMRVSSVGRGLEGMDERDQIINVTGI